jgi:hypothetical protein
MYSHHLSSFSRKDVTRHPALTARVSRYPSMEKDAEIGTEEDEPMEIDSDATEEEKE